MRRFDKKTVARILAVVLAALMVVGMFATALPLLVSAGESEYPAGNRMNVLPKQEIFFTNHTIPKGVAYEVPRGGVLLVEEGATLTIYGSLLVSGTLKNDGTILISSDPPVQPDESPTDTGYLTNRGVIRNNGKVTVLDGSIHNQPRGEFYNAGELLLTDNGSAGTQFYNITRKLEAYTEQALLENTGRITLANHAGNGIVNQKGSVVDNQGIMVKTDTGTYVGELTGNSILKEKKTKEK